MAAALEKGDECWVPEPTVDGFIRAKVVSAQGESVTVQGSSGQATHKVVDVHPVNPSNQSGCKDNTELMYLREPHMLYNLRERYAVDSVYTYTAHILIACNPFKRLQIYSTDKMIAYAGKSSAVVVFELRVNVVVVCSSLSLSAMEQQLQALSQASPLVSWSHMSSLSLTAPIGQWHTTAFRRRDEGIRTWRYPSPCPANRISYHVGCHHIRPVNTTMQAVIISGESGSGKTETAKIVMSFLTWSGVAAAGISIYLRLRVYATRIAPEVETNCESMARGSRRR
jgi:hypothetical protein